MIRLLCDSVGRIIIMTFRTCCDESSCCGSYKLNKQQMFRLEVIFCHNDSSVFMGVFKVIQGPFMPKQSCLLIYKSPDWSRNGFACLKNQFDWHLNWITWTRCALTLMNICSEHLSLSRFVGRAPMQQLTQCFIVVVTRADEPHEPNSHPPTAFL